MARRVLDRWIPPHFADPFGLAYRIARSGSREARFAMATAALGVLAAPLDVLLSRRERGLYSSAGAPRRPIVFIAGAPRSGTTLATQVLLAHLPVGWINNLSAVFPRAPLIATHLFKPHQDRSRMDTTSFYGKTLGFGGPNDALHIWDRWFGADRTRVPQSLGPDAVRDMRAFFGALEEGCGLPVLNKNNSLNLSAHLVARALETSHFICMVREPLYLAQSLYRARLEIHGDLEIPYGIPAPHSGPERLDVIEQVCRQALYHERMADEQQARIGRDRFWLVSYENFCADPAALVARVSEGILGTPLNVGELRCRMPRLRPSRSVRVAPETFRALEETMDSLTNGRRPACHRSH